MAGRFIRGVLTGARGRSTEDDEPATEPLSQSMLAAREDPHGVAHTGPIFGQSSLAGRSAAPRSKKPRVSFNTVTSTTFVKDGEDPFKLSSPQERQLSPLLDSSLISDLGQAAANEEEESTQTNFPSAADLCGTPLGSMDLGPLLNDSVTGSGRSSDAASNHSGSSVTGMLNPRSLAVESSTTSAKAASNTPERQRAGDVIESGTPGGSPGEMTGEVTGEVGDISQLVYEDEMQATQQNAHSAASRNGLPSSSPTASESQWNLFQQFKNDRSDDEESVATRRSEQHRATVGRSPDTANLVNMLDRPIRSYGEEALGSDFEESSSAWMQQSQTPVYDAAAASAPGDDVEMSGHSQPQEDTGRLSQPSQAASMNTQETFDFVAINDEFDRRIGLPPSSSPPQSSFAAKLVVSSTVGGSSNIVRAPAAPGLGLLASLGARSPRGRSPGLAAVGRVAGRSPKLDFARWASTSRHDSSQEHSLQESESGELAGRSSMMHPIKQLTGGPSSLFGTRIRISWDDFANQSELKLPLDHQAHAPAPRLDASATMSGLIHPTFDCPRAFELHQSLQQQRAECLEQFVDGISEDSEQKRNEYSVAKQMWERSQEVPAVAGELLAAVDDFERESFIVKMKEWHQYCKDEAWLKWHIEKRAWLENDFTIVKQHTQVLREEEQRFIDVKKRCKEVSNEIRGGSARMRHMGELQDIKQAFQELGIGELRRMQEERQLIQRTVPEEQAALEVEQKTNTDLEQKVQDLRRRIEAEEVSQKETRKAALQQQLRKNLLVRQYYAHTCIMTKATPSAVRLQMRGNINLWIERAPSSDVVRLSVENPTTSNQEHPCIKVAPELRCGLLACAWYRVLATVVGSGKEKVGSFLNNTSKHLEAAVPCQELHRFLRSFDVEVLRITDQLRAMNNVQKNVPEVAQFSAELGKSPEGDQPFAELTAIISVLCSHSLQADGFLKPLTVEAKAGKFSAVECSIKFNADLATLPDASWLPPTVEVRCGHFDTELVAQAARRAYGATHEGSFVDALAAAVQAIRHAALIA